MLRSRILATAMLAMALMASGCGGGGGDDGAAAAPGSATIAAAGGTVEGPDGVRVVVPADAFASPVTVRIAKDSTGAPPLPDALKAAGAVYAITPHGGDFHRHVEVTIPLPATPAAENEQRVLVTAEPGATRWTVLSGATPVGNALRVPVMHFSYFQVVTLVDIRTPTVTVIVDRIASVPVAGTTQVTADHVLTYGTDEWHEFNFETRVVPPANPVTRTPTVATTPAPRLCMPSNLGPAGGSLVVRRNDVVVPLYIYHDALYPAQWPAWPRNRLEASSDGFMDTVRLGLSSEGPGVAHFWGQDQPRSGAFVDLRRGEVVMPPNVRTPVVDRYTLPPAGNVSYDDELIWFGVLGLGIEHNGRIRVDAGVATDCGFDVAAVPLAFQLQIIGSASDQFFPGVQPIQGDPVDGPMPIQITASIGQDVNLGFSNLLPGNDWNLPENRQEWLQSVESIAWEFSADGHVWRAAPEVAPWVVIDTLYFDPNVGDFGSDANHSVLRIYGIAFRGIGPGLSGYYRATSCVRPMWDDPRTSDHTRTVSAPVCQPSRAYRLEVVSTPPTVTRQPAAQTVLVGETASLSIAVQGNPAPALQWQRRSFADAFLNLPWTNIPGATAASYTTPPLTLADHPTLLRVAYSNASGGGFSDVAMVSVVAQLAPPVILAQPGSQSVGVGATAVFAATADGAAPLSYQWRKNGVDIAGANAPILTLASVTSANDGRYDLAVSNRAGSVTSEPATLVVTLGTPVALPPAIAQPPASLAIPAGSAANFAVAVTGTGPYSYVWMREGQAQPVGNDPILAFAVVQPGDAGRYQVRVTNTVGTVLSAFAELTVGPSSGTAVAPAIVTPPVAVAVLPNAQAVFAVGATGSGPLAFQWRRDGVDIAGANAAVLTIAAATSNDAGQYSVEVRNGAGVTASAPVPLVIIGAPQITTQPAAASAAEGASATFSVGASGSALRYQWTRNGVAVAGATASTYKTPALVLADSGAAYAVIVYNGAGLVFSAPAALTVTALPPPPPGVVDRIAAAFDHTCGVTSGGATACWGYNSSGQLGSGNTNSWNVPRTWSLPESVVAVAAGQNASCALTASGRLFCSGNAAPGSPSVPTEITGIAGIRQVVVGIAHACALAGDRRVWCWGNNSASQLGDGGTTPSATPVQVQSSDGPLTEVAQLEAGDFFTCAVLGDGSAACWGQNNTGQTGATLGIDTTRAVPFLGLAGVMRIAAGANHACALLADATVRCWGDNSSGQIGNGTTSASPVTTPAPLPGLAGVQLIASGSRHMCAVIAGRPHCWGTAPMGNGNVSEVRTSPVQVSNLSSVVAMAAGAGHTCALRTDGDLQCWGSNGNGQLGVGDMAPRTTPVVVNGTVFATP